MRFIGNKENLLNWIDYELASRNIKGQSFFDFFSGTVNVAKFFKKKNYQIYSCDLLYFSYVLQKAYIENNNPIYFEKLIKYLNVQSNNDDLFESALDIIINYLNNLELEQGFVYHNYAPTGTKHLNIPRMYFTDKNAQKIDAIRKMIELWKHSDLLSHNEYYILLAILIESVPFYANISGVYAAFNKKWDIRTQKDLKLRSIDLIYNKQKNKVFNGNSLDLINNIHVDIIYLDPPYNQRQYAPNYHLLETIALYDNPKIQGVTGMRDYTHQKSNFCNLNKALYDLEIIASQASYRYLLLSYNNEGLMPQEAIIKILNKYGDLSVAEYNYPRFKSNNNGFSKSKKIIQEQLYILERC